MAVFFGWMFLFSMLFWISVAWAFVGWSNEWLSELGDIVGVTSGTAFLKTFAMEVSMLAAFKRRKVKKERDEEILKEAETSGKVNIGGQLFVKVTSGRSNDTDSQEEKEK